MDGSVIYGGRRRGNSGHGSEKDASVDCCGFREDNNGTPAIGRRLPYELLEGNRLYGEQQKEISRVRTFAAVI